VTSANKTQRKNERGVTIVLVAFSLLALLGLAALAIDVATLYAAHGEAQRAADAAALAGARMFASSGYTSASPSWAAADVCQTSAGPGAAAAANRQAEAVAAQNQIAGQPATVLSITCNVTPANPQIAVTVQQTGLPSFFGRIWGPAASSVSATAVAEAYNPSGSAAPIQVRSVKPWLIPDCDPDPANPGPSDCGAGSGLFVDPANGSIKNNGSFVGEKLTLTRVMSPGVPIATPAPRSLNFYRLNVPIRPPEPICPSTSAVSCGQVGSDNYRDNIACTSTFQFSCGQTIGAGQAVTVQTGAGLGVRTNQGTQCLIHAGGQGLTQGQDALTDGSIPVTITGGDNNPNPLLQGITNISRSDSIITVPIYHKGVGNADLCPGGCTQTATIVGFLQLGITQNAQNAAPPPPAANGKIEAVIMNVAGCNPGAGGTAVSGGGVSPIPVRLIHQ
jgi:Flp pilus assembly protein TadG